MDQPPAFGTANGATSAAAAAAGVNPFQSNSTHRSSDSGDAGADLNMTEESVAGPTPRAPENNAINANPNSYQ